MAILGIWDHSIGNHSGPYSFRKRGALLGSPLNKDDHSIQGSSLASLLIETPIRAMVRTPMKPGRLSIIHDFT